jgi:hypothetical protein
VCRKEETEVPSLNAEKGFGAYSISKRRSRQNFFFNYLLSPKGGPAFFIRGYYR